MSVSSMPAHDLTFTSMLPKDVLITISKTTPNRSSITRSLFRHDKSNKHPEIAR